MAWGYLRDRAGRESVVAVVWQLSGLVKAYAHYNYGGKVKWVMILFSSGGDKILWVIYCLSLVIVPPVIGKMPGAHNGPSCVQCIADVTSLVAGKGQTLHCSWH